MLRVGIGGIFHETNTFAGPTAGSAFQVLYDANISRFATGARTYLGGLIDEATALGLDAVPLLYAEATPSGTIEMEDYLSLRDELVERVAKANLDGLLLSLHGAGVADGVDSIEEDIGQALRSRMGNSFRMVATLDLHGNIRQDLGDLFDGLFPVRFNPHTDQHERGVEAARCLCDQLLTGQRYDTAVEQVPMMFPPIPTNLEVFKRLDTLCIEAEIDRDIACARIMHGFPYVDVPQIGASVVVVARHGQADAASIARRIAAELWGARDDIKVARLDADAAVTAAVADGGDMVVINEFSDNTGGGTPGDGTHLLSALLANGVRACFSHIFDPETARQASLAGTGAEIDVELGGRTNPILGPPIKARAVVLGLNDGLYRVKSPMGTGEVIDLGLLATLRIGNVDVIVSSGRRQTLDDGPFIRAGIDIAQFRVIALKSSQHFRAWYEPRASRIITADPPGLSPVDVGQLRRSRSTRDLWPLSPDAQYPSHS